MTDGVAKPIWTDAGTTFSRLREALPAAISAAAPPLLFALRLWASVCLALFVAFYLELDNPYWAGTSAAIVCLPQLGASLRKGWFRMIGTLVGATMIVVLTACFPQDRIAFLGLLALWGAICACAATLLRNFASYAAALAGYTAMIIAVDVLGATGGPNTDVFMVAVTRASEICIGIVCAGIVLAGTDLGGAQRRLAESFATLASEITGGFIGMLARLGSRQPDTQPMRRELVRRVIALDPVIDQALGESSEVRYRSAILQAAVHGLFRALDGWRGVAAHLTRISGDDARRQSEIILWSLPSELHSGAARWMGDPLSLRRACEEAWRTLIAMPADSPSLRLLAEETAKLLAGILRVLDGLALCVDAPGWRLPRYDSFQLSVPDLLPALVNGARAFIIIGAVALFWVVSAWPGGDGAMVFVGITLLLLSPKGELAFAGALAFTLGCAVAVPLTAAIKFAVLPSVQTFPAFCLALGLYLIPMGFGLAHSRRPAALAVFSVMAFNFVPLLQPTNQMTYDTGQFYNFALAVCVGCGAAATAFRLLPQLSPAFLARRLLALTLRDLRRLAIGSSPAANFWEGRMYGRLAALPDSAAPLQRSQLLAALSVGSEIMHLRRIISLLGLGRELDAALAGLAEGQSATARAGLARIDHHLSSSSRPEQDDDLVLRARARIIALSEALTQHAAYFDAGAPA